MWRHLFVLFAVLVLVSPATAQEQSQNTITVTLPGELDPTVRAEVLEALGAAGAAVEELAPTSAELGWQQRYAYALDAALAANADVPALLGVYWARLGGVGGLVGVLISLAIGLIGWAAVQRACTPKTGPAETDRPRFRTRLRWALRYAVGDVLGILAFFGLSFAVGYLLLPTTPPAGRLTVEGVAQMVVEVLVYVAIFRMVTNPADNRARLAPLDEAEARLVWRAALTVVCINFFFRVYGAVVVALAERPLQAAITLIAVEILVTATRIWFFWRVRRPIRGLIEHSFGNGRGAPQPPLIGWLARSWVGIFVGLSLARLAVVASGELTSATESAVADTAYAVAVFLPFVIGGIGAWFDDREPTAAGNGGATVANGASALIQGTVLVVGIIFIMRAWGISPFAGEDGDALDHIASAVFQATGAVVVGWALWRGVRTFLDQYAPKSDAAELDDDSMGKTGSRIDTLVPVFRSAALVVIVVVSTLTALAALGINIGPLLAGAGVVGLAVGFGAQTLVKDVITGIFYLVEDAFRVGEYIETEAGKGVVEKISLRTVRLRHHRGPVYTIPFGTIGTVQNHSRDWVKIKIMLRVPFSADIEKVRKLIKAVGIGMMDEPELAASIISPVKSQGVLEVDDSAIVIGVKFICKPGEQFVIRREAYARIKKAFAENDIDFAPKRVIVEADAEGGAAARAGAAAAAAAHMADAGVDAET